MASVKTIKNPVKNKKFLALFFCLCFILLGFFSVEGFNWSNLRYSGSVITTDELAHIPAGYYYLKTGKYFLNVEHPPLIKDLSALPLLFLKPTFPNIYSDKIIPEGYAWENYPPKDFVYSRNLEIRNAQWDWARVFLFNPQNNPELIAFWARLSIVFFNAAFLFFLYFFLSKNWNIRIAVISLFLIVFSQFSLAHGSLVTMDFMSSVLQMLAIVCFAIYIKKFSENQKAKAYFILELLFLSLSLLSKFSSVILMPSLFVGGLLYTAIIKKSWKSIIQFILSFIRLSLSVVIFISIYYYPHTVNMAGSDMVAQINHYYPNGLPFGIKNLLVFFIFSNPILKGIAQYINGIIMVFSRMSVVYQKIFFMGKVYGAEGVGASYFPILYLAKLSIGLLILNLLALLLVIWKFIASKGKLIERTSVFLKNPLSFLFLTFAFLYMVISLSSNLQIGLRHIMPIILTLTILTAKTLDLFWDQKILNTKFNYIFYGLFAIIVFSVLITFPNYLSYYNILAGGAANGYKIATDSNFDWGQDTKKLVKWVEDNNIQEIYIEVEGNVPLQWYLGNRYKDINIKKNLFPRAGSYVAVAISKYEINKYSFPKEDLVSKIGDTILIFKLKSEQSNSINVRRRWNVIKP